MTDELPSPRVAHELVSIVLPSHQWVDVLQALAHYGGVDDTTRAVRHQLHAQLEDARSRGL